MLFSKGDYEEAEPLLLEALAIYREKAEEQEMTQRVHDDLANLYTAWGKPISAARYKSLSEK